MKTFTGRCISVEYDENGRPESATVEIPDSLEMRAKKKKG
jgi:hypothetical protein